MTQYISSQQSTTIEVRLGVYRSHRLSDVDRCSKFAVDKILFPSKLDPYTRSYVYELKLSVKMVRRPEIKVSSTDFPRKFAQVF